MFYEDNNANIQFVTCPISSCVWSPPTKVPTAGTATADFWNSGGTVYYVSSSNSWTDSNFYFGTGVLSSSGTVSWSPEQTVSTGNLAVRVDKGIVDSGGNAWVAVSDTDGANSDHFQVFYHTTSWATSLDIRAGNAGGFPNDFFLGYPVSLTAGKVAVIYQETYGNTPHPNANIRTCSGIGCTWSSPVTDATASVGQTSATNIGDTVQFCSYNSLGTGDLDYLTFAYGASSWNVKVISPGVATTTGGYNCAITTNGVELGVVYSSEGPGTYYTYSLDGGATWSPLAQIDYFGATHSQRQTVPPTFSGSFPLVWYCKQYPVSTIRFATLS